MMSEFAGAGPSPHSIEFVKGRIANRDNYCQFTYNWTVKNFISQYTKGTNITSPSFSSRSYDFDDEWILIIKPNKIIDPNDDSESDDSKLADNNEYVSVELQLQSFDDTLRLSTKCQITINSRYGKTKEQDFDKFPDKITWNRFILKSSLFNSSNEYIQNDELQVYCTIIISKNRKKSLKRRFARTQELSVDWKKLLLSEKSADVTIQVGQKSFRAIKGILAIRSPVFSTMFDHEEFKDNNKNEIVIEDIDEDVFEEFLHFIYTGESSNIVKMPMELLAVAEKYQVDRLKKICEKVICETINFDNVANILVCSDTYNLKRLNETCLEFMKKNVRAVLLSETFQVYKKKNPEFFFSVLEELLLSAKSFKSIYNFSNENID